MMVFVSGKNKDFWFVATDDFKYILYPTYKGFQRLHYMVKGYNLKDLRDGGYIKQRAQYL